MVQNGRDDEESAQPKAAAKQPMLPLAAAHTPTRATLRNAEGGLAEMCLRNALDRTLNIAQLRGIQWCGRAACAWSEE